MNINEKKQFSKTQSDFKVLFACKLFTFSEYFGNSICNIISCIWIFKISHVHLWQDVVCDGLACEKRCTVFYI